MIKNFLIMGSLFLGGCMTLTGDYRIEAQDENGQNLLPKMKLVAQGRGLTTTKISLCRTFPKATIRVYDLHTNEEIKGQSPRKCR